MGVFFYLSLGLLISFLFFFSSNGMLNILHNFKDTILGSLSWIFQHRSKPKLKANDLQIICFSAPLNHCLKLQRKYQGHGVWGVSIPYSDGSKGKRLCLSLNIANTFVKVTFLIVKLCKLRERMKTELCENNDVTTLMPRGIKML